MGRLPPEAFRGKAPFLEWVSPASDGFRMLRDSRVAEAKWILRGPWSIVTRALFLEPFKYNKEVVLMLMMFKECPFYRASESLIMGKGIGYCDLDCDRATCNGDKHL